MRFPRRACTRIGLLLLFWPLAASISTPALASPAYALIDPIHWDGDGGMYYKTIGLKPDGTLIQSIDAYNLVGPAPQPLWEVSAVNNQGDAAGSSGASGHLWHAQLFKGGAISDVLPDGTLLSQSGYLGGQATDLGTLGGYWSNAAALNDADQVVGASATSAGQQHAFLYSGGQMTDLGTLGGNTSAATAISSNGLVVGTSTTADGSTHGFLDSGGKMIDLGTLGPATDKVVPVAVNASGQVVGTETEKDGTHGFLYSNGKMIDLFGPNSGATGINSSGQVIGWSNRQGALLYSGGQVLKLTSLIQAEYASWADYLSKGVPDRGYKVMWVPGLPRFINDQGQIVAGAGTNPNGPGQGGEVLLTPINGPGDPTPVPEPRTLAVFAAAAVAGLGWRRARRPA